MQKLNKQHTCAKSWKHYHVPWMARMFFFEYSLCLVLISWTCYLKLMVLGCPQCPPLHSQQTLHVELTILWENGPNMTSEMMVFPELKRRKNKIVVIPLATARKDKIKYGTRKNVLYKWKRTESLCALSSHHILYMVGKGEK